GESPVGIERRGIVNWRHAHELQAKENQRPNEPAYPLKMAQWNEGDRQGDGNPFVQLRAYGTHDVAAVELADGQKIQRSGEKAYPRGAADRMKQQVGSVRIRLPDGGGGAKDERHAKNELRIVLAGQRGNHLGMHHAVT